MEQDYGSECSSGCESGWTFYLGQSMYPCDSIENFKNGDYEEDDDDDMSMVSDASSGPPHVHQHEQEQEQKEKEKCNKNGDFNGWKRENTVKETRKIHENFPCFLAGSATSSLFNFSHVGNNQEPVDAANNVIADYSQVDFQSTSKFQDQFEGFKLGTQLQ